MPNHLGVVDLEAHRLRVDDQVIVVRETTETLANIAVRVARMTTTIAGVEVRNGLAAREIIAVPAAHLGRVVHKAVVVPTARLGRAGHKAVAVPVAHLGHAAHRIVAVPAVHLGHAVLPAEAAHRAVGQAGPNSAEVRLANGLVPVQVAVAQVTELPQPVGPAAFQVVVGCLVARRHSVMVDRPGLVDKVNHRNTPV
jgi:hypothetical protein